MKKIIVASNNKGKIKEIKEIFKEYEIISLNDLEKQLNHEVIVNEDTDSYEGNALQKVNELVNQIDENVICMADDSGLSIDSLDGFPGVHTARWLDADDHTKNLELLNRLKNSNDRLAHYTTCIAIADKNMNVCVTNTLDGVISSEPRGTNGFGFDEIFELDNGKTLAEIDMKTKLEISPRRNALLEIRKYIK